MTFKEFVEKVRVAAQSQGVTDLDNAQIQYIDVGPGGWVSVDDGSLAVSD